MAPLAGITNRPFRLLARKNGADICCTEMISSDAIVRSHKPTLELIDIRGDEHPIGVQLFGASPEYMARAVAYVSDLGADLIDLNLGCPVKKIVNKNGGAAILKNINLASELMDAAVQNSKLPITIKMRTGWEDNSDAYLEVGKMAEKCGVAAVTLHPRSRSAGFSGKSDWRKIGILKKEIGIPVIGNGDINTPSDAAQMIAETGCDAIMIGRAAMKNPYIFQQIRAFLATGDLIPDLSIFEKVKLAMEHSLMAVEEYGEYVGVRKMRKHLSWYSKGFPGGASLRQRLNDIDTLEDIKGLLSEFAISINPEGPFEYKS